MLLLDASTTGGYAQVEGLICELQEMHPQAWMYDILCGYVDVWYTTALLPTSLPARLQFGAFMREVDLFDAAAYGLSAAEASAMDPQHRWVLAPVVGQPGRLHHW